MTGKNRRKNKHPKRAENVKTVVVVRKGDDREEEGDDDDVERLRRILTCVPCDDDVVMEQNQMREEETACIAKGVKRKRGHECDVCDKVFGYPSLLAIHMRTHTNERPYECDVCEKSFTQSGSLTKHMRTHTKEKPYECDVCDKAFRESGHLKYHMRTHTKVKPYECDVCEKRFRESSKLKIHMRIHTQEKPYECDVCEKRFSQSSNLKRHMRNSPEWLTAVEAFLHDAKDDEEKKVSKQHTKPYGNPSTGSCLPNEMKVQIQGIAGSFCSPKCGSNMPCPADAYKGASAKGQCVLQVPSSPTPSQCALICRPEPGTNGGCPKRAECQPIQGLGICTYPSSSSSSSSEIEDGKEEQVTLKIAA
ncbi:unnamed protein product [Bathycoccus prasinos]